MIRQTTSILLAALVAAPAFARTEAEADARLLDALQIERTVGIMADEGLTYAQELAGDLFPGRAGASWEQAAARIYDRGAFLARMEDALGEALSAEEIEPILAFVDTDLGRRIVELELSAREAYADEDTEAAAIERWNQMEEEGTRRAALVDTFIVANDLLERNVAAGLSANYEFLVGLNEGGAFEQPMPEDAIIAQAYGAEEEIRGETSDWLGGFLSLSYAPLSDEELQSYIDFSDSEAGRDLNRALFEAFDAMYDDVSREMGRAAAVEMAGEDI